VLLVAALIGTVWIAEHGPRRAWIERLTYG